MRLIETLSAALSLPLLIESSFWSHQPASASFPLGMVQFHPPYLGVRPEPLTRGGCDGFGASHLALPRPTRYA